MELYDFDGLETVKKIKFKKSGKTELNDLLSGQARQDIKDVIQRVSYGCLIAKDKKCKAEGIDKYSDLSLISVFTVAYARWELIKLVKKFGDKVVYCILKRWG